MSEKNETPKETGCICPVCGEPILSADATEHTEEGLAHAQCCETNETPTPSPGPTDKYIEACIDHCESMAKSPDLAVAVGKMSLRITVVEAKRARQLERELAEARKDSERLNWMDSNRTCHIYAHFKFHPSTAATQRTWREAIDSAMKIKP